MPNLMRRSFRGLLGPDKIALHELTLLGDGGVEKTALVHQVLTVARYSVEFMSTKGSRST